MIYVLFCYHEFARRKNISGEDKLLHILYPILTSFSFSFNCLGTNSYHQNLRLVLHNYLTVEMNIAL